MTDIIWLDENENEPRKQNFAIRQLLERVPGIEDGITAIEADITAIESDITDLQAPPACFFAHKNGTDQAGVADSVSTQITFSTENFDVGSHFAASAWTPPAGKVLLMMSAVLSVSAPAGNRMIGFILKNGGSLMQGEGPASGTTAGASVIAVDAANGTDVYTAAVFVDASVGTGTVIGLEAATYFSGFVLSP